MKVLPAVGAPYITRKSVEYEAINTEPELNDRDAREYEVNSGATQLDFTSRPDDVTIPLVDTPLSS